MDDEYELMSHESVERLQEQLRKLKKGGSVSSLQASIDELNANIQRLLEVFREASRGVKAEDSKINTLLEQNEKIARAILAVADIVQEKEPGIPRTAPFPMPPRTIEPAPLQPKQQGMPPLGPLPKFEDFPLPPFPKREMPPAPPSFGMMPPPPSMYPEPGELPPPPGYLPPLPPKKKGLFRR